MELADQCIEEEIVAHNLLWLRKQYGYSQKEMARLLGIGVGSLRKLEHGVIPPRLTVEFLEPLYFRFQITPSMLLCTWLD